MVQAGDLQNHAAAAAATLYVLHRSLDHKQINVEVCSWSLDHKQINVEVCSWHGMLG